jgi:hypothetical protein
MYVQIQTRTESLHERDGARLRVFDPQGSSVRPVARKHGINEDPHECAEHVGPVRGKSAKLERQRQDPLAHRYRRHDSNREPGGDVAHAPSGAARANTTALTR